MAACSGPPLVRDETLGAPAFGKLLYTYRFISRIYTTDHFEIQQMINRLTVHDRRARRPAKVRFFAMTQ